MIIGVCRCKGVKACPAQYGGNTNAPDEIRAIRAHSVHADFGLHINKAMTAFTFGYALKALPKDERDKLSADIAALHNGGATVRSNHHRRRELASAGPNGKLLTPARRTKMGELAEALDCLARLSRWGLRVAHATWQHHRNRVILLAAGLVIQFSVLMLRNVPVSKSSKTGERLRDLYGNYWHQLTAHLIPELKRVSTALTMSEWMEMLWGNLRRLTLATSDRKLEHTTWNMSVRTQMQAILKEQHGARNMYASDSYSDHGAIAKAYAESGYEKMDDDFDLELDERIWSHSAFAAFALMVPEHLELGIWHYWEKAGGKRSLMLRTARSTPNFAQPARRELLTPLAEIRCAPVQ